LDAWGAPPEIYQQLAGQDEADEAQPRLWPQNAVAWRWFLICGTQWRTGFAGPVGLDYPACRAAGEMAGIAIDDDLFGRLRVLEMAVLDTWRDEPT